MKLAPITRLLACAALGASLVAAPALAQERIKFKAIGQPLATGLIQKNKEQPFFENFAARTGLPIDLQDERLTSREAEERLALRERDWRKRKDRLDAAAAAVMLQDWLDQRSRGKG